ncbi:MAG: gliding motility protein GldM, partial [Bacteroidetes bacterium]|nr:gliding motility protein GldM [Bacteroidota bacterium]
MASAKDTPRQKMIGMMYLVLTALLALNVSKDILDAFIVVNKGLENTNVNFTDRNDALYSLFDLAKSVDPVRVTPNWKLAQDVKKRSEELTGYINKLQKELIAKTEGVDQSVADTIQLGRIDNKDSYDTPTNIMIGNSEDGSAGASRELKNKLNEFKSKLTEYILPQDRTKVKVGINTEDPENSEENENWELYNFYNRPLVASVTILSKLKNDVKNAEATTVDYLLKLVDVGNLKFDTVAAKVIPQSNYVMLGEEYKADVFLAAFNKTKNPEINVGDYNEATKTFTGTPNAINVERGLGKYTAATTREGIVNYSGTVKVVSPDGKEQIFPFKSEYIVAKPALTVAAENMNVVYRGLPNPISVSVPGIPTEKLTVSATNAVLTSKGNGKYEVKPNADGTVNVSVTATLENGEKRNMGSQVLRIKRIPKPNAKFAELIESGSLNKGTITVQRGLIAFYPSFEYDATPKITSFSMSILGGGISEDFTSNNN